MTPRLRDQRPARVLKSGQRGGGNVGTVAIVVLMCAFLVFLFFVLRDQKQSDADLKIDLPNVEINEH